MSADKIRQLALADFQLGSYETALQPGELLAAVIIPPLPQGMSGHYVKFTTGSSEERPCAGVAALARIDNGVCQELRLAVGAVSAKPVRIAAETLANGKALTPDLIATIAAEAAAYYRSHRRCARAGGLQTPSGRRVDPARAASARQRQNGDQVMTLVGTNVEMVGGRAKVSGAVSYVADMEFPGQLYAKALRSPYPHAKLLRIDASKAAALPGVARRRHARRLDRIESLFRHRWSTINPCWSSTTCAMSAKSSRGGRRKPGDCRRGVGADRSRL